MGVAGSTNNIGAVLGGSRGGSSTNCYYLAGTGANSKDGITEVTALTAAMLGDAFTDGDGLPALAWESSVSADTPVRPEFVEGTERSAQLAAYIRAAVKSAKTHGGVSGTLLGSEKFTSGASSTATDWLALAMGRFGHRDGDAYVNLIDDGTGYADYLAAMKAYIEKTYAENNGALHSVKATEWHRAVVAIAALGGDPTDFGTCNGQPINLIALQLCTESRSRRTGHQRLDLGADCHGYRQLCNPCRCEIQPGDLHHRNSEAAADGRCAGECLRRLGARRLRFAVGCGHHRHGDSGAGTVLQ